MRFAKYKLTVLLGLVIVIIVYILRQDIKPLLNPTSLQQLILSAGRFAVSIYVLLCIVRPVFFFPGPLLAMAGGIAFGTLWGTVYNIVGSTLGAALAFFLARKLGTDFLARLLSSKRLNQLNNFTAQNGFKVIFYSRLMPAAPFDVISYASGLSNIKFRAYFWGTLFGTIPGSLVGSYLGNGLKNPFSPQFLTVVVIYIIFGCVPYAAKYLKRF